MNNSFYSIDDEMDIQIMEILANGDLSIKKIADRLQKGDLFTVLAELRTFFTRMNVGEMSFSVSDTVSITVKDVNAHGEMGRYLQGKIISTISKTAMEQCSGKRMNMNDLSWTGNDLTVRYSFARF